MAIIVELNYNTLASADALADWFTTDNASSPAVNTNLNVENTGCIEARAAVGINGVMHDLGANTDLSNTHIVMWGLTSQKINAISPANTAGYRLRVSSDANGAGNFGEWAVGGSDAGIRSYEGWFHAAADTTRAFDKTSGTPPALTAVRSVGFVFELISSANRIEIFVDRVMNGLASGSKVIIRATDATPFTFAEAAVVDKNLGHGFFKDVSGVFFAFGGVDFGRVGTIGVCRDTNQVLIFEDHNSGSTFNALSFVGDPAQTNEFTLGTEIGTGVAAIGSSGCTIVSSNSANSRYKVNAVNADTTVNFFGCSVIGGSTVRWEQVNAKCLSSTFADCDTITVRNGAIFRKNTITDSIAPATSAALDLGGADPAVDTVRDLNIYNSARGILLSGTGNVTYNFRNIKFVNNTLDVRVNFGAGDTVTINILEGGDTPTIDNVNGSTVNVVNAKVAKVTCIDSLNLAAIQNVRVLLEADAGGDLPVAESVTITRATTVATVTHTAHGLTAGQKVTIRKADQQEYNGVFVVDSVTDANTYTYTVSGAPATPATGAITATGVLVEGLTNASGVIENTGWPFTNNQPVIGTARKSTASPRFKSAKISGTLDANGFTGTTVMTKDE